MGLESITPGDPVSIDHPWRPNHLGRPIETERFGGNGGRERPLGSQSIHEVHHMSDHVILDELRASLVEGSPCLAPSEGTLVEGTQIEC